MSNYKAYWDNLVKSAPSHIKDEYYQTERSKPSSFQSVGEVLRRDFGYQGKN